MSWDHWYEEDELSANLYTAAIGGWVTYGIVLAAIAAMFSYNWPSTWPLVIGCAIVAFFGIYITIKSSNWMVSALGYSLVAGGLGLLAGPYVALFTEASVARILVITAGSTFVLSFIGLIIPQSLESWGAYLYGGLTLLIVGNFGRIFLMMFGLGDTLTWLDWVSAGIFMIYIIHDWNRGVRLPRTMDNAVDVACALFLDVINLFLSLLATSGKKKSDE